MRTGEGWFPGLSRPHRGHGPRTLLAAVLDLHTRKIVGWSMRETLHAEIAVEALEMAVRRQRPAPGLICHTDRGIQYACEDYRKALEAAKITPSMSRKGDCLDNAPMESFFGSLKTERVHHQSYATRDEARRDLFAWTEGWYTTHRLHSALGYRSSAAMERAA
ncbi:integrase-like protein [Palleronia aestuarii]|uniref:Integrase-like protein n=2 Tax=Palleronia aestuarii TaxID=568105 RepID=A0A2W7NXZ7_9RHOB|nr:integrase-like protein [Palleronia aestuarii]